jgi:Right handed beta helix region
MELSRRARHTAVVLLSLVTLACVCLDAMTTAAAQARGRSRTHSRRQARPRARRQARAHGRRYGARTFYVAPDGNDASSGTSPRHPWRTVGRVDRAVLAPGDTVCFEGGASFTDATLMPGEGFNSSGRRGRPIRFASYGRGRARLTQGIWLGTNAEHPHGPSWLSFRNLALGPSQGFQGTGTHVALIGLHIGPLLPPVARQETGIQTEGSRWVIAGNTIDRIGGSGMLLGASADSPGDPAGGRFYLVSGNTITRTGLDAAIGYPTHGIYLKAANALIAHNRIVGFRDDGVSARYRDAVVRSNRIADGGIGIAWYQYDRTPGRSRFEDNVISNLSTAGIFVCGVAESCVRPLESFDIAGNHLRRIRGEQMNLQPTAGTYLVKRRR